MKFELLSINRLHYDAIVMPPAYFFFLHLQLPLCLSHMKPGRGWLLPVLLELLKNVMCRIWHGCNNNSQPLAVFKAWNHDLRIIWQQFYQLFQSFHSNDSDCWILFKNKSTRIWSFLHEKHYLAICQGGKNIYLEKFIWTYFKKWPKGQYGANNSTKLQS